MSVGSAGLVAKLPRDAESGTHSVALFETQEQASNCPRCTPKHALPKPWTLQLRRLSPRHATSRHGC